MRILKQPLIIGYILSGIIIGPFLFNLLPHTETLEIFSQFGIAFLLFIVGLHLNPKIIKDREYLACPECGVIRPKGAKEAYCLPCTHTGHYYGLVGKNEILWMSERIHPVFGPLHKQVKERYIRIANDLAKLKEK